MPPAIVSPHHLGQFASALLQTSTMPETYSHRLKTRILSKPSASGIRELNAPRNEYSTDVCFRCYSTNPQRCVKPLLLLHSLGHVKRSTPLGKKPPINKRQLTLLGVVFVVAVFAITFLHHTLLLPVFIGLSTTLKALVKLLTPKFLVLLFKNSLFLKVKQLLIRGSTRFVVLSHKPWRHKLRKIKSTISHLVLSVIRLYMNSPLWIRTAIALGLLFVTASSSYVVIALLIIPRPILAWAKRLALTTLNRTGITHLLMVVYKFLVPRRTQRKWYMHRKWAMGRRQIVAARRLRETILDNSRHAQDKHTKGKHTNDKYTNGKQATRKHKDSNHA